MSEETSKVKCPKCGLVGNPGEFCMNGCGRLPAVAAVPAEPVSPVASPVAPATPAPPPLADALDVGERLSAAIAKLAATVPAAASRPPAEPPRAHVEPAPAEARVENWANIWNVPPPAAAPSPTPPRPRARVAQVDRVDRVEVPKNFTYGNPFGTSVSAAERGECPVELEGVIPDAFALGTNLSMRFRVFGRGESGQNREGVLKLYKDEAVLAESPRKQIRTGRWTDFSINYRPCEDGRISVRLVLEFTGADCEAYESDDFDVTVYPNDLQQAKSIAVNINNEYRDINVDRAGEARFGNTTTDIAKAIESALPGENVKQILDRCNRNQKPLRYPLRAVRLPSRLTLVDSDGFELHVFSNESLSFGRSTSGNDAVLRVFGSDGQVVRDLSLAISKTHFRISRQGIQYLKIQDGGLERDRENQVISGSKSVPSSLGTLVDGRLIGQCGTANLRAGDRFEIGVAPINGTPVLTLDATVGRCPEGHRGVCGRRCPQASPSSLLIKRCDGVKEAYLAVWQCAPLGDVFPDLEGYYIHWDGTCFKIETPHHDVTPLRLGNDIGPDHSVFTYGFVQSHI